MPYPRKVTIVTDFPSFETVDSEREYVTHKVDSTTTTGDYYERDGERAFREFYEDDETGIITRDVAKFEAWMRTVVTK